MTRDVIRWVSLLLKTRTETGISVLPSVYDEEDKDGRKKGFDDGIEREAPH